MTSLALSCQIGAGSPITIPRRVRSILNKYGATMLLPGVAEPILGPDIGWGAGVNRIDAGWSHSGGGVYTCNGTSGFIGNIANNALVVGRSYEVVVEITAYTSGSMRFQTSGDIGFGYRNSVGVHRAIVVAGSTAQYIYSNSFNGAVRLLSVREILGYNHTRYSYQAGNYRESTGQTLAAADQQVGLVVDAAGSAVEVPVTFSSTGTNATNTVSLYSDGFSISQVDTSSVATGRINGTFVAGNTYEIRSSTSITSGSFKIDNASWGSAVTLTNSGSIILKCLSSTATIDIYRSVGGTLSAGSFRNISVRELPGIHASQSTSGFQPVLRNASGIQSWQFDGTDDRLSLSAVPFQMADDHFVVIGAEAGAIGATRHLFSASGLETQRLANIAISGTGFPTALWRDDAGTLAQIVSSTQVTTGGRVILAAKKLGVTKSLRLNGVNAAPDNTTVLGATTVSSGSGMIGTYLTGGAGFFNGHIHGVIFGKGAITDSELLTLERWAAQLQGRQL